MGKILKKSYYRSRVMRISHFWAQNTPICPEQNFWYKLLLLLSSTTGPFHWAKFKKNSCNGSRVMRICAIFGPSKMVHLPQFCFLENYQYHSHLPINPFYCPKFLKNSFSRSRVTRCTIFPRFHKTC